MAELEQLEKSVEQGGELQPELMKLISTAAEEEVAAVAAKLKEVGAPALDAAAKTIEAINTIEAPDGLNIKPLLARARTVQAKARGFVLAADSSKEKAAAAARTRALTAAIEKAEADQASASEAVTALGKDLADLSGADLVKQAGAVEALVASARAAVVDADDTRVAPALRQRARGIEGGCKKLLLNLAKVRGDHERTRCHKAIADLRKSQVAQDEPLFAAVSKDGALAEEPLAAFLREKGLDYDAALLCEYLGPMTEEEFASVARETYSCVKSIAISDGPRIGASKILRSLELGEKLEFLDGPVKDEDTGISRIKARSVKDKKVGWVTLKGNQGTVYLSPAGLDLAPLDRKLGLRRQQQEQAKVKAVETARLVAFAIAECERAEADEGPKLAGDDLISAEAPAVAKRSREAVLKIMGGSLKPALAASSSAEDRATLQAIQGRLLSMVAQAKTLPERVTAREKALEGVRDAAIVTLRAVARDGKLKLAEVSAAALLVLLPGREEPEARAVIRHIGGESPDEFAKRLRPLYRCAAAVGLCDNVEISQSKILKSIKADELVEAIAEPQQDASAKVQRLRVRTLEGSLEGWASIKGNQGTTYLEPLSPDEVGAAP